MIDFDDQIVRFYDAEDGAFHYMANVFIVRRTKDDFLTLKNQSHQHWEAFGRNKINEVSEVLSEQNFVNYLKHSQMEGNQHGADVILEMD